jgi:uncharacterized membrane protein
MLIPPPDALIKLFKPWNDFYGDSKLTETIVMFAHTGGLVLAGGIAVATDRLTLRARSWTDSDRQRHLVELGALHRTVVTGLVIIVLSGLAMLCSDLETFWGSWIYWVKMTLIVLLLVNGGQMVGIEKKLATDSAATSPHWARLRTSAAISITLWLTVTLAGVALLNFA